MSVVNINFDATELNQALAKMAVVGDKLPSELVNQKGQFIFSRAAKNMKSVQRETIQTELGASAAQVLVKLKSGRFSRAKKHVRTFFSAGDSDSEMPLLAAIIQARSKRSGKPSPWKGVDRATGGKMMLEAMQKVYSARQKSRAYFKRCFAVAREIYRRRPKEIVKFDAAKLFSEKITEVFEVGDLMERAGKMADVTLAKKDEPRAVSTFWIKSTERDTKDALDKYAAPVLQAAVDAEAESTFEHAAEREYKDAIKAFGIKVS